MIRKWWKQPIFWLMTVSYMLVLVLSIVWLKNTFQIRKGDLVKEVSYIFTNTVRDLEDSISREIFYHRVNNPSDSLFRPDRDPTLRSRDEERMTGRGFRRDQNRDEMNAMRRRFQGATPGDFLGSLGFKDKLMNNISFSGAFHDTTFNQRVFTLISEAVLQRLPANTLPYQYKLVEFKDTISYDTLITKPYHDVSNQKKYALAIGKYHSYILSTMAWELFFIVVVLALVLIAFSTSYHSMIKQRKLSLLKSELVSNISHELKTPIATVSVALEALSRFNAGENPVKRQEYLEICRNELSRLTLLVESVLNTSLTEGKSLKLNIEYINVKYLIDEILNTLALQFEEHGAIVHISQQGQDFNIPLDRVHMTGVIYNLLDNALKYSNRPASITIALIETPNTVIIKVTDEGIGIPSSQLPRIFEKFFRVPGPATQDVKGYGLGLSYVSKVIKQHGGKVSVKSLDSKGTSFTLELPRST